MASALQNGIRGQIFRAARQVVQKGLSVDKAAKMVLARKAKRSGTKGQRAGKLAKLSKAQRKKVYARRAKTTKQGRAAYSAARRMIAAQIRKVGGAKYTRGFSSRHILGHARKYVLATKHVGANRKSGRTDVSVVRAWNAKHVARRAQSRKGKVGGGKASTQKGVAKRGKFAAANPRRHKKARRNVSALGALAFTNPSFSGVQQYLVSYALPVTVAGGAAGAVHAFAAHQGWTDKIEEYAGKVPVVGEYLAMAPHTIQGLLVGSVLAAIAPMIGGKAGTYLALTGGAAIVFGGGIDAFNAVQDKLSGSSPSVAGLGDLAFTNMGDLAFTNMGDLAFTNGGRSALGDLGDGMAFQTAPLTAGTADYAQASLADAFYSGADFGADEGQALINGRSSFLGRYGAVPYHMSTSNTGTASHLAGREGHRWGWLIKLVGWDKACAICSLPPAQRLEVLRKTRLAALAAFKQSTAATSAADNSAAPISAPAEVSGSTSGGAGGADGAHASYGDPALFMGA